MEASEAAPGAAASEPAAGGEAATMPASLPPPPLPPPVPAPARAPGEFWTLQTARATEPRAPEATWWHERGVAGGRIPDPPLSRKEPPRADAPRTGLLPPAPRPNRKATPSLEDFPEKFQEKFTNKKKTPYARMYCFYGIGDSAGQWQQFIDNGPSWCEIIVYEHRYHGLRAEELHDRSFEERADDAWASLCPAFQQHARGGCIEGAPFAFFAHSAGSVLVCMLGQRLRAELGLEPTAVYIADQRPPDLPTINEEAYAMVLKDPFRFIKTWHHQPAFLYEHGGAGRDGVPKQMCERWMVGMAMLEEYYRSAQRGFHVFDCPLWIFQSIFDPSASMSSEEKAKWEAATPADVKEFMALRPQYMWVPEDSYDAEYLTWSRWTSGEFKCVRVNAAHDEIWRHMDTEIPLWRHFIALADIHERMPKAKPSAKSSRRR